MKTNDQRIRPAVALFCGFVVLGVIAVVWLGPKFLSSSAGTKLAHAAAQAAPSPPPTVPVPHVRPPAAAKPPQDWGIEVVGLYPTVGGRVLDLRYKILDPAKAALLPNEAGGMYLIDEATGAATGLPNSPKTGSIPQNPQKLQAGRSYSLGFPNPGGHFKSGSKVTLVMGNFRAEHLAVQ